MISNGPEALSQMPNIDSMLGQLEKKETVPYGQEQIEMFVKSFSPEQMVECCTNFNNSFSSIDPNFKCNFNKLGNPVGNIS